MILNEIVGQNLKTAILCSTIDNEKSDAYNVKECRFDTLAHLLPLVFEADQTCYI